MTDAYTALARCYDRLTSDVDYKKWADYIERHFRRLKRPVRSVVELGCGTGSLTRLLARRGYAMTAVDLSPDMLSIAEQKCRGLDVLFLCQDMSRLTLAGPQDAVISCLDSVNYVTRPAALRRTFQRVHRNLAPGGLFLFDVKTPAALEGADGQTYLDEDDDLFCVWRGEYSPRRRVCGYGLDLFVREEDGSWSRGGEYHEEYAYTMEELDGFLREAGFQTIKLYGDKTMSPPKEGAQRVFFAARKEL
ncbi:MAG: class I SAM-dependent methyltransferase [Oscillospiraceae bacterium]|nr:class I SAM-dependent methyltransferase [Oscillospiraceae bacterium]MDE7171594.1 class I SAM-dependent methyltransferase [Oscillospiraceae bacterium]